MLQDIWMAETRKHAEAAFDAFVETYGVKYDSGSPSDHIHGHHMIRIAITAAASPSCPAQ
jgi:hypothetical protein